MDSRRTFLSFFKPFVPPLDQLIALPREQLITFFAFIPVTLGVSFQEYRITREDGEVLGKTQRSSIKYAIYT